MAFSLKNLTSFQGLRSQKRLAFTTSAETLCIYHAGLEARFLSSRRFSAIQEAMHRAAGEITLSGTFSSKGQDLLDEDRDECMEVGHDRVVRFPAERGVSVRVHSDHQVGVLHAHGVLNRP